MSTATILISRWPGRVGDDGDAVGFEQRHDARAKRAVGLNLDYQIPFLSREKNAGRGPSAGEVGGLRRWYGE
jgi:hypothetical protein